MLSHKKIYMLFFVTFSCCAVEPGTGGRAQKEARERFFEQLEERAERRDRMRKFLALLEQDFYKKDRKRGARRRAFIVEGCAHINSCENCKNGFCGEMLQRIILKSSKL